jgi:hypothetical protein
MRIACWFLESTEEINHNDLEQVSAARARTIRKGENVTRKRMQSKIAAASAGLVSTYRASGDSEPNVKMIRELRTLGAEGVL